MNDTLTFGQVSPWSRATRRRVLVAMVCSLFALTSAYAGASAEDSLSEQAFWLDLAVLGSIVAGSAQAIWLVQGRRSVSQLRRHALRTMTRSVVPSGEAAPSDADYVTVAAAPWVHRPSCLLAFGKDTQPALDRSADAPCPVCRP